MTNIFETNKKQKNLIRGIKDTKKNQAEILEKGRNSSGEAHVGNSINCGNLEKAIFNLKIQGLMAKDKDLEVAELCSVYSSNQLEALGALVFGGKIKKI